MHETINDNPINMSTRLSPNVAQYLHPEYLQPLSTTLDAKKSPLALLAQTCSSIGKHQSPSKSIILLIEKDKKEIDKNKDKTATGESSNRTNQNNASGNESGRDSTKKYGLKNVHPNESPPPVPILGSSTNKSSPALSSSSEQSSDSVIITASVSRTMASSTHSGKTSSSSRSSAGSVPGDRDKDSEHERERERNRDNDADVKSRSRSSPKHISSNTPGHIHHGINGYDSVLTHPGLSLYGHGFTSDQVAVNSAYASSLAAAHSGYNISASAVATLIAQNVAYSKSGLNSALSPYGSYARVKAPSGATARVCRDPYCNNCQSTIQVSHVSSTCTVSGCSQCAHEKSLHSLSALGMTGASSLSMLPQYSLANSIPSMSSSGLSSYEHTPSLYAHSLLGATAAQSPNMPYVCNWIAGTNYCGKRYGTPEELLQHARTHTTASDSALMESYMSLGFPPVFGLPGYSHVPLPAHSNLSPNSIRGTYPTIPSPLNSVLHASRYHPYKSPFLGVQSSITPEQVLTSLGTYYSPYSLYGHHIGAAAVP